MGYLFGLSGVDENQARLRYLNNGAGVTSATSSFILNKGVWYDIAFIVNDGGDSSTTADNTIRFMANSSEYGLQTSLTSGVYISGAQTVMPSANMLFMSESTSSGTGNERKAFDGIVDYIAVFDVAMTDAEALAILGVPEPSRALLLSAAMGVLLYRRRRGEGFKVSFSIKNFHF